MTDTPQPPVVGSGFGADAKAIARWDVVPYQTFDCEFEIGVVAFHINGIDRVEFSLNDGPWAAVTEMTRNPRTDVVEYWAILGCEGLSDGPVEVRAVVYPTVGIPRVLGGAMNGAGFDKGEHSLFLSSNANGTLPELSKYVSNSGDDATGDGSMGKPYKSIMKAARAIQDASGTGNADGGRILLAPGEYRLGVYTSSLATSTENRWLVIEPKEEAQRSSVQITSADASGLRTKLVRLKGLTLAPKSGTDQRIVTSNGPLEDYFWLDGCRLIGPGRAIGSSWSSGVSGIYDTNNYTSNSKDGIGAHLCRSTRVGDIGSDAFSGSGLVVNCELTGIDSSGTSFHADVLQYYDTKVIENRIAYRVIAKTKDGQGVFAGNNIALSDIAIVGCDIDNQVEPQIMKGFQLGGPTQNLYILDCTFRGSALWRTDMAFSAHNVVVKNSHFIDNPMELPSPISVDGVTYIPAPGN